MVCCFVLRYADTVERVLKVTCCMQVVRVKGYESARGMTDAAGLSLETFMPEVCRYPRKPLCCSLHGPRIDDDVQDLVFQFRRQLRVRVRVWGQGEGSSTCAAAAAAAAAAWLAFPRQI